MRSLWDFALLFYRQRGVSDACIELQDQQGIHVTLLLFALWAGYERGVALVDDDLSLVREGIADWHANVVMPLRQVRRRLKEPAYFAFSPHSAQLRGHVKAIELEAERLELQHLESVLPVPGHPGGASAETAICNLAAVLDAACSDSSPWLVKLATALHEIPTEDPLRQ
jgi:uncharacterized protein (TIGR02444 family)